MTYIKTAARKKANDVKKSEKYTKAQSAKKAVNSSVRGIERASIQILAEISGVAGTMKRCF